MSRKRRRRTTRSGSAARRGAPLRPEPQPGALTAPADEPGGAAPPLPPTPAEPPQAPWLDWPAERLRQFEDARRPQIPAGQPEAEGGLEPSEEGGT